MIYIGNTNPNLNFPEIKGFNSHTKLLLRGRGHLPPWPKKPGGVVQAAGPRRRSRPKRNRLRRRRWVWKVWQGLLGPFWEAGKKPCPSDIIRLVCCNELLHLLPGSTEMSTLKKKNIYSETKVWCSWSQSHGRHHQEETGKLAIRKQNARYRSWSVWGLQSNISL